MLLWADGFEHYGTDTTNMLDGLYADLPANTSTLSSAQAATGSMSWYTGDGTTDNTSTRGLRKALSSSTLKIGVGQHLYFPSLPNSASTAGAACILALTPTSAVSVAHLTFVVGVNGEIHCYRGSAMEGATSITGGTLLFSTDPILTAAAWHHVEIQASIHNTLGWVRIAVNGVHRHAATGLDTAYNSEEIGSVMWTRTFFGQHNTTTRFYLDNVYVYDFDGDSAVYTDWCPTVDGSGIATNYMGEWQCVYLPPNADTAEDDWAPSTGTDAYAMVDETTPNDADYISSTTAADLSELALTDLPEDITVVRGLMVLGRMSKSDTGPALVKFGMKSVSPTTDAAERPITVEPTYWWDFINVDPNTNAATGTLTFTGQPANGDTVTVNAKVYTFQTVLTNVDGNVFIGADLATSISNLAAAINLGAGSGTAYAAATTLNANITAVAAATTLTATAKVSGTAGNAITTSETSANASWGGATLSGGGAGTRWTRASLNAAWVRLTRTA